MTQRAPKRFLILLAVGLIISFSLGMYLEECQRRWLQDHPISVNLISGVIGFCGGFLTVALVYNRVLDSEWVAGKTTEVMDQWYRLIQDMTNAYAEYQRYLDGIRLATVNWAPVHPADTGGRAAHNLAGLRFKTVGLEAKEEMLRFIQRHAPSSSRVTAAAERLFDALDEISETRRGVENVEEAERALDRLSRELQADVRRRYRHERQTNRDK